ncbi:MAG TPA: cadherin-like beta sandwich domain-containing protein, partial [Rectinemataceae bacterium]
MIKKSLAGAGFVLAALLLIGCPTGNEIVLSSNANLEFLGVGGYELDSTFSASTTSYKAFVDGTMSSISLIARLADSDASLSWSVADPSAAPLAYGKNSFTVSVTAEDGQTKKTYSIDVWRCNAYGNVIDSVGGSYLSQTVSYKVYAGGSLVYSVDRGSSKDQPLYFASGTAYKVVAGADGRAASSKDNFRYSEGDGDITLVCQKHEQSTFPAEAPSIVSFAYTTTDLDVDNLAALQDAGVTWTELSEGANLNASTMTIVRAVVTAKAEVDPTSWAGQGIMFGIDELPGFFGGYYPQNTDSTYTEATDTFRAEAYIDLGGMYIDNGEHVVSLVVYDRSGNRSQRDVKVNVAAGVGSTTKDLSVGHYIDGLRVVSRTYGVSRQYYSKRLGMDALDPGASGPATCRVTLTFGLYDDADEDETFLGFRVYRSADGGSSFKWIGTVNYGGWRAGWKGDGVHTYYDLDPDLEAGRCYVYKVTAFSDGNPAHDFSDISAPVVITSPYTVRLDSPADGSIVAGNSVPTLKYSLSDTALWNPDKSTGFCFAPAIR